TFTLRSPISRSCFTGLSRWALSRRRKCTASRQGRSSSGRGASARSMPSTCSAIPFASSTRKLCSPDADRAVPFTPYHFGPGLLVKSLVPRYISLTAYCAAQVAIDCETLYFIVRHSKPDHRFLHTMVGASLVGFAVAAAI